MASVAADRPRTPLSWSKPFSAVDLERANLNLEHAGRLR